VRSEPAIFLQERMALFAANFIRWATCWLAEQAQPANQMLEYPKVGHQAPGAGWRTCFCAGDP
jgi:hypothetical protein